MLALSSGENETTCTNLVFAGYQKILITTGDSSQSGRGDRRHHPQTIPLFLLYLTHPLIDVNNSISCRIFDWKTAHAGADSGHLRPCHHLEKENLSIVRRV
ncbi:hypothetical protein L3X38_019900 [Prunus dulcis]|uniref:Uncharacterized protein n=1 Tax=Prunus dulcis TaxID=3755 RepID=A0AAD4ZCH6_PRUDU|nr:hypothetical protein L3X38_019900 [Prunus dulcis]